MMKILKRAFAVMLVFAMSASMTFAETTTYEMEQKENGASVADVKESSVLPFVRKAEPTKPSFLSDNLVSPPVIRLRLNEGSGNTVTMEKRDGSKVTKPIINKTGGAAYEWVNDAAIRYGSFIPQINRSNNALKLNDSYVDLGSFDDLGITDEMTIVYWANYEIQGKREEYSNPSHLLSPAYGYYSVAYPFDKSRYNTILQSGAFKFGLQGTTIRATDGTANVSFEGPRAAMQCNYYNIYFVTFKKTGESMTVTAHANDLCAISTNMQNGVEWTGVPFNGNLYLGSADAASSQIGLADVMVFDRALTYQERLQIYNGCNQVGYVGSTVPEK